MTSSALPPRRDADGSDRASGSWPANLTLVLLFLAFFGRFLAGQAPSGGDIVNQYLPYQQLIRQAVRQGAAPLWNSYTFLGRPLMADIQVGVLYPPNWLHWMLPLPIGFALVLALHGAWMAWGCRRLGRAWGLAPGATALGATLFLAAPFFALKASQGVILFLYVGAWWPWMALAATRLARRPGLPSMALLAVTLALSLLAGSPQMTFYGWLVTLAIGLIVPSAEIGPGTGAATTTKRTSTMARLWLRRTAWMAGAFGLALGLTAIQTAQTYYFIHSSFERGSEAGWAYVTDGSLEPRLLWLLLNPALLGIGSSDRMLYWGSMTDFGESCFYAPLWTLALLAPLGWAAAKARRKDAKDIKDEKDSKGKDFKDAAKAPLIALLHRRLAWLGVAGMAAGLVLGMGSYSYPFRFFFEFVPGFDSFRVPARLMIFWTSGLALLAALAADALLRLDDGHAPPRSLWRWWGGGLLATIALTLVPWLDRHAIWSATGDPFLGAPQAAALIESHALTTTLRIGLSALAAAAALAAWLARPAWRRGWGACLPALVAGAELAILAWPFQASVPWSKLNDAFYPRTPLIQALTREHRGGAVLWMDDAFDYLHDQNQPEALTNRLIMQGLPQARGYDPVNARWIGVWFNLLAGLPAQRTPGGFMFVPQIALPGWLTLMGVETVVGYRPPQEAPELRPVASFDFPPDPQIPGASPSRLFVWRNERFLGRAFAAPLTGPVAEDWEHAMAASARRAAAAKPGDDPRASIALDGSSMSPDQERQWMAISRVAMPDARYRVRESPAGPNGFHFDVDYPEKALLCLAQSAYEGWTATVDGAPAELVTDACGAFVTATVPAGRHRVEFRFAPSGLAAGEFVSAATLLGLLYFLARPWASRRRAWKKFDGS
jgi:hypothetical protein